MGTGSLASEQVFLLTTPTEIHSQSREWPWRDSGHGGSCSDPTQNLWQMLPTADREGDGSGLSGKCFLIYSQDLLCPPRHDILSLQHQAVWPAQNLWSWHAVVSSPVHSWLPSHGAPNADLPGSSCPEIQRMLPWGSEPSGHPQCHGKLAPMHLNTGLNPRESLGCSTPRTVYFVLCLMRLANIWNYLAWMTRHMKEAITTCDQELFSIQRLKLQVEAARGRVRFNCQVQTSGFCFNSSLLPWAAGGLLHQLYPYLKGVNAYLTRLWQSRAGCISDTLSSRSLGCRMRIPHWYQRKLCPALLSVSFFF